MRQISLVSFVKKYVDAGKTVYPKPYRRSESKTQQTPQIHYEERASGPLSGLDIDCNSRKKKRHPKQCQRHKGLKVDRRDIF